MLTCDFFLLFTLTHWELKALANILLTTLSNWFSCLRTGFRVKLHWNMFERAYLKSTLVQVITGDGTKETIDQSHRYGRHQAACREPAGSYDKTTRTAICFEHKTQYLLIRAPYTHIVVFWHVRNIPPIISQSQISCNSPTFYITAIFVKYCYTTGSWLL